MKHYQWMLFAFMFFSHTAMAQMSGYEYWLDGNYEQRTFVENVDGKVIQDLDVSGLVPGIHRYNLRAQDDRGRWSAPFSRYFLRLGQDYTGNEITSCEYAIDNGAWTNCAISNGQLDLELPVQHLLPGIHRIMFRFCDKGGRWSASNAFYFLRLGEDYSANTMQQYEYWLDGDYASRTQGTLTDGTVQLELATDDLCYGVHRFTFRAQDAGGRWSTPLSKFFVKVEPSLSDNQIVAYEYWFNSVRTTRVDVSPANPFSTGDLWIDIEGVVPNAISQEYTVDWATNTAYCPDDVVFGIQFVDKLGNRTPARVDTFAYQVPVKLDFQTLTWNDSTYIERPSKGEIYAYEVSANEGDPLMWSIGGACRMDIYTENGERLHRLHASAGSLEQEMEATYSGRLFALVYDVKNDSTSICCHRTLSTGISATESGIRVFAKDNHIVVNGAEGWSCSLSHLQGYVAAQRDALRATECFVLPKGIYVVRLTNEKGNVCTRKVSVP